MSTLPGGKTLPFHFLPPFAVGVKSDGKPVAYDLLVGVMLNPSSLTILEECATKGANSIL